MTASSVGSINSDYAKSYSVDTNKSAVKSTTYLGNFTLSSAEGGVGLGGSDWTSGMRNRNGSFAGIAGTRWATGMATSSFTPSSSGVYYFGADFRVVGRNLGAYANMKLRVIDTVTNEEQTITLLTPSSGYLEEYFTKGGIATLIGGRKYTVIFQVDTSATAILGAEFADYRNQDLSTQREVDLDYVWVYKMY